MVSLVSIARHGSAPARLLRPLRCGAARRGIKTLTVNAGSTTLKYALYDVTRRAGVAALRSELLCSGLVDKVGGGAADGSVTHDGAAVVRGARIESHAAGFGMLLDVLKQRENVGTNDVDCVGHRVVHGGAAFSQPTLVTGDVLQEIRRLSALAPLHNPPAADGIVAARDAFPEAAQVAVFDTAFHATMPPAAYRYAIPKELYEDHGLRRYGFHGTSFQYVMGAAADYLGKPPSSLNLIILHLGGGASMCCIEGGKSVDTTMGLTPLEGLAMATRSGDLDPGVYDYLLRNGHDADSACALLNKESGLLGLTGTTSDMRVVKQRAAEGDADCRLAREVFSERCRKYLGSYLVKLEGDVDAIVFTGGIGEGDADMRQNILQGLDQFQIGVDTLKNENAVSPPIVCSVSPAFATTEVLVVPTDEESSIAMQSSELVLPEQKVESIDSLPKLSQVTTNLFCHSVSHAYTGLKEVGLLSVFAASVDKVGYFRPIAKRSGSDDFRVKLMQEHFDMSTPASTMYGVTEAEAAEMIANDQEDVLIEKIIKRYLAYSSTRDFVLVGTYTDTDDSLHWAGKLCSTLNIPAIMMGGNGHNNAFGIARTAFQSHGAECLGVIASQVENIEAEREYLRQHDLNPLCLVPYARIFVQRSVREVLAIVDDGVVLSGDKELRHPIEQIIIHTMQVGDLLDTLENNQLVVVSHKRVDVVMSLLLAAQSANAPDLAGILVTQYTPGAVNPKLVSILKGLGDLRLPVIATSADTFQAVTKIENTPVFVTAQDKTKLNRVSTLMAENLDYALLDHVQSDEHLENKRDIGPSLFQYAANLKARKLQKNIVMPEGADARIVEAASILVERKLCNPILVGDPAVINENATKLRVSLEGVTICDPQNYQGFQDMVESFVECRKSKGLTTLEAEHCLLEDVNYFGTMMIHMGLADGMVSGAMHSSANTIRPALQILKTAPGASVVSSVFFMLLEDGVKVFGDCAINVAPDARQLAEIAVSSAKTSLQFGIEPRVALLSYATGDSNAGDQISKVIEATALARKIAEEEGFMDPQLIQGPLQFDAAVDPAVAAVKAKDSPVAGRANCLIFPDLNAGNNGYKAVQQAANAIAVGPVLQGLRKPVNDLSRGATVDDIVNTAVVTALQAAGGAE